MGSMGLAKCRSKPASIARCLSSSLAYAEMRDRAVYRPHHFDQSLNINFLWVKIGTFKDR